MTFANSSSAPEQNQSKRPSAKGDAPTTGSKGTEIPFRVVVPIVLIGAVVLLMGLPLGAVFIVNSSGCCFANGPEGVVTFWAALTAGFLALFGMLITGVFIITAFKVDDKARAEAWEAADKAVTSYLNRYSEKELQKIAEIKGELCQKIAEIKEELCQKIAEIKGRIEKAVQSIETQRAAAAEAIANEQQAATEAANESKREIEAARAGVEEARADVEEQHSKAISAIDRLREEVENAAEDARERIAQATRSLPPPAEDKPQSPDE